MLNKKTYFSNNKNKIIKMEKDVYISANKITKQFDVTSNTLRRWAEQGKIRFLRPNADNKRGGKRVYNVEDLRKIFGIEENKINNRKEVCYARVSSNHQKEDLQRQIQFLKDSYPEAEIIQDIGSGLSWNRVGFKSLLDRIYERDVSTIVVTYRDRLCRFGFELIEWLCKKSDVKIVVLGTNYEESDPTRELSEDLLSITTVFVAKNNGLRSAKFRKDRKKSNEDDSKEDSSVPYPSPGPDS